KSSRYELTTYTKYVIRLTIYSIHNKFEKTPGEPMNRDYLKFPANLPLADPEFHKPAPVDLLLGSGPTLSLLCIGQINLSGRDNNLYMQKTRLGWIIGGEINQVTSLKRLICNLVDLQSDLNRFWEIEEGNVKSGISVEAIECERNFKETVTRDKTGRYIVALPFKGNPNQLGEKIAKIFDPLGLLGPIILYAKKIMQQLWVLKLDWDESENPADKLSRGQTPRELLENTLCKIRPPWLLKDASQWPQSVGEFNGEPLERKKNVCLAIQIKEPEVFQRFSSFSKLKFFIACCLRFRYAPCRKGNFIAAERNEAELFIIKSIQRNAFNETIQSLQAHKSIKKCSLLNLDPFLDEDGWGKRLRHAELAFSQRHPILLLKSHHVTQLIIQHFHEQNYHSGVQNTLYNIRQRFWLVDGRNQPMVQGQYLNELNIRKKWTSGNTEIKEGTVVLLKDDNIPPMQWHF
ncbi:hypothetical protein NQ315_017418, partial [Exocentrus adspersus]